MWKKFENKISCEHDTKLIIYGRKLGGRNFPNSIRIASQFTVAAGRH